MATRLQWRTHNDFSKGVMRDVPSYKLPEGYMWEAMNVLITREGSLQKRLGVLLHNTSPRSLATAGFFKAIGHSTGVANTKNLLYAIHSSTTARIWSCPGGDGATRIVSPDANGFDSEARAASVGTPTVFTGQTIFPLDGNNTIMVGYASPFISCGGVDLSAASIPTQASPGGSTTITAGNKNVTLGSAVADMQPGMYIHVSGASNEFTGRIAIVNSTTNIDLEQTPATTFTGTSSIYTIGILAGSRLENGTDVFNIPATASCLAIHQNRIVLGGVGYPGFSNTYKPNKIQWSTLFTAGDDSPVTGCDGLVPFTRAGWPRRNFETLANLNRVVAVIPYGINQLIVFGDNGIAVISGSLGTITADTSTSNYTVKYLSLDVGCISDRSIQETPAGIMFASRDGIYVTDGNTLTNVLVGKIQNDYSLAYTDSTNPTTPTTISGSALLDNRIYMCGFMGTARRPTGTIFIDIANNFAITQTPRRYASIKDQTEQLWIYMSAKEPGSSRVYGIHNVPGRNGFATITRLDSILDSPGANYTASAYDFYDTTLTSAQRFVYATVQTKAYVDNDPVVLKRFRHTKFQTTLVPSYVSPTTANNFIKAYYVLGLDGDTIAAATKSVPPGWLSFAWSPSLGNITRPSTQTLPQINNAFTTRFDTQAIADGISYIISDQVSDGLPLPPELTTTIPEQQPPLVWELQELSISHNALRQGRTFDGSYGTSPYVTFTFDVSAFDSNALFE